MLLEKINKDTRRVLNYSVCEILSSNMERHKTVTYLQQSTFLLFFIFPQITYKEKNNNTIFLCLIIFFIDPDFSQLEKHLSLRVELI